MIGVAASMEGELSSLKKQLKYRESKRVACFDFEIYDWEGGQIVTGICGTGKASAAAFCQAMIIGFSPRLIVNIGTAGSIDAGVKKKDLIVITDSVQHDFDASPFGYRKGELVEAGTIETASDERFIEIAKALDTSGMRVHFGRALTGDIVVVAEEVANRIREDFGGLSADMETGAFAQICAMNQVPFAGLRGISDDGEEDRHAEFRANIGTVADITSSFLLRVLGQY